MYRPLRGAGFPAVNLKYKATARAQEKTNGQDKRSSRSRWTRWCVSRIAAFANDSSSCCGLRMRLRFGLHLPSLLRFLFCLTFSLRSHVRLR